jgi:hypothetical protein
MQEGKTAYDIAVTEGKHEAAQLLRVRLFAFMASHASRFLMYFVFFFTCLHMSPPY